MLGFRAFLALRFDLLEPFFDLRNPEGHFLLLVLELFQSDDLIADFGKIDRLRAAFATERDLTFLQAAFFMAQGHTRLLPPNFESDLAQSGSYETHGTTLRELRRRQIKMYMQARVA